MCCFVSRLTIVLGVFVPERRRLRPPPRTGASDFAGSAGAGSVRRPFRSCQSSAPDLVEQDGKTGDREATASRFRSVPQARFGGFCAMRLCDCSRVERIVTARHNRPRPLIKERHGKRARPMSVRDADCRV